MLPDPPPRSGLGVGSRRALAQLVPIIEALFDLALEAALARPIEAAAGDPVRKIVLAGEAFLGGVVVDRALAVAEIAHQPRRRVEDVHRRHQRAGLVRHPAGFPEGLVGGVRFRDYGDSLLYFHSSCANPAGL